VAIDKKLRLGGMENSPPKADQSPNRFKVANNVTFTDEGYITPRASMSGFTGNTVSIYPVERWTLFSSYKSVVDKKIYPLKLGIVDQAGLKFKHLFLNNTLIPSNNGLGSVGPVVDTNYVNNFSDQSVEVNNVKYILSSPSRSDCKLIKYDGYEASTAGIGIPYFSPIVGSQFPTQEPAWSTTTGSRYVKVIGHALDLQGNQITSSAVSYRTTGNSQGFNNLAAGFTPEGTRILVGVGDSGIAYTYDGINWDANVRYNHVTTTAGNSFGAVTYGNGIFVALQNSSTINQFPVWISSDGVNWRRVEDSSLSAIGGGWSSVTWSGSRFVAVRFSGGATAAQKIMWSSDGIVWQYATTVPALLNWTCVAYGGTSPLFVAINENGATTNCVMTSPDGVTWTIRTVPTALQWNSVTWGAGPNLFVAVARNGAVATNIITSPDGITWTSRTSPAANIWRSVTFGSNIVTGAAYYIAVSSSATTANKIMYSTNGTTWTGVTGPNTEAHYSVAFFQVGTTTANSIAYYVSGAFMNPAAPSTKGFMYAADTSLTTIAAWTQQDSPVTTKLNMSAAGATVTSFLRDSGNQSYFDAGDMNPYFYGTATYSAIPNRFNLDIGSGFDFWGIMTAGGDVYLIRTIYFTITSGVGTNSYGAIAYKYNSTGNYFEGAIKIFNIGTGTWEDSDGASLPIASGTFAAGRRFYTVWAAAGPTNDYFYKGLITAATYNLGTYSSDVVYTVDIRDTVLANRVQNVATLPFSIASNLGNWYDSSINRTSFNDSEVFSNPYIALTLYQDLLLLADSNVIYFSDFNNGGSLEMNPSQFIVIGESQYGRITSIVGTKDYLIVSRERKVYMVAGNITTQNIRVQEIPEVPVGAYSNTSMIEIYGTVFMMASSGAWLINAANARKISSPISLNFKTFLMNATPQFSAAEQAAIGLNMNNYLTTAYDYPASLVGYVAKYLTTIFDPFKSKVIVTNSDSARSGQSLVFHTNNGEWTTYDAYDTLATSSVTAMTMVESLMYVGTARSSDNTARTSLEDFTSYNYDYVGRSPSKLVSTWMTQGEPSLEKLLLQVKIFGYLFGKLDIKHYANWDYNTAITNTTYTSPGNYVMFHKQRLNSSKPMAAAIELTMNSTGTQAFWIEGIEVEFEPIQQGMKR
jgi:hypothetical protein